MHCQDEGLMICADASKLTENCQVYFGNGPPLVELRPAPFKTCVRAGFRLPVDSYSALQNRLAFEPIEECDV